MIGRYAARRLQVFDDLREALRHPGESPFERRVEMFRLEPPQGFALPSQKLDYRGGGELRTAISVLRRAVSSAVNRAHARFDVFLKQRFDLLLAEEQRVDLAPAVQALIVSVERGVDAAQHDVKRDAALLPGFDQRPVERRYPHVAAAPLNKLFFDFSEIVEVVHRQKRQGFTLSQSNFDHSCVIVRGEVGNHILTLTTSLYNLRVRD